MAAEVFLGIDGGGTTTRALVADRMGRALAYVETGGANPSHNAHPEENVREAIRQALAAAGRAPQDVASLVAGMAGVDTEEDQRWAQRATTLPGLDCPRRLVNDS